MSIRLGTAFYLKELNVHKQHYSLRSEETFASNISASGRENVSVMSAGPKSLMSGLVPGGSDA